MSIIIRRLVPVLFLLCAVAALAHDPTENAAWKALGDAGAVPKVRAVAVDGDTVFALCEKGLLQIGKDGKAAEVFPADPVNKIQALAVDGKDIWLGGPDGVFRVVRANLDVTQWEPKVAPSAYDRVLFDGQGGIYIYEKKSGLLSVYDKSGALRWRVMRIYDQPETLSAPEAVVRRKSGEIYLADAENNRVLKFTANGQFLGRVLDLFCRPHGLAELPDGRLAVLNDYTERIDTPLITLYDAADIAVADWVSDQRVVSPARPVWYQYSLDWVQRIGSHPKRPVESFSPLTCCAAQGTNLLVGQGATGTLKSLPPAALGAGAKYPARLRRIKKQEITASKAGYTLQVGGTLDWTNTTRWPQHTGYTKTPFFMVDDAVTLTNDGTTPVINPHFSINGKGDYFDAAHIQAAIVPPGAKMTETEKAFAIYNFFSSNLNGTNWPASGTGMMSQYYVFSWWGIKEQGVHLTSKWNNFGAPGACGCYSAFVAKLATDLGLPGRNGGVVGHCPSFVIADGKEIYLDAIMNHSYRDPVVGVFCPMIDDQGYAGYEDIVNDQYLIMRVTEYPADFGVTGCFGKREQHKLSDYKDLPFWQTYKDTSKLALTLRPGESITRRTAYLGRSAIEPGMMLDATVNGDITYTPNFADGTYKFGAQDEKNIAVQNGALAATAPEASIVFTMACPHPLLTGSVKVNYLRASSADRLEMDINVGGRGWETIWRASKVGQATEMAYLYPLDQLRDTDEKEWPLPAFNYAVRFRLTSSKPGQSPAIQGLTISSLFQTFYQTIPRMTVGNNVIAYEDETPGPHHLTITHRWKESAFGSEPQPPAAPVFPANGTAVKISDALVFKWEPGASTDGGKITEYEWMVSKRPDFMWPVAPNYRIYTRGKTEEPVPEYSLLCDGTQYYWRVRCQSDRGVWGPWSKTWTFRAVGPRVPRDVKIRQDGSKWILSWAPNKEGTRPVKYEIFADNSPGFVPIVSKRRWYEEDRRKPYDKPSNIILTTDKTEAVVVDAGQGLDRSFFRVAAIDADGARSGPSGYVGAKHPFVYTAPVTAAKVGQAYSYQARTLTSLGDFSLPEGGDQGNHRHHKDKIQFALKQSSDWLKLDPATGLLTGTPLVAGAVEVTLEVTDGQGGSATQQFKITVSP
ncbi:MAG: putative Ig domain-containing protein [Armatimonadota bacterium]